MYLYKTECSNTFYTVDCTFHYIYFVSLILNGCNFCIVFFTHFLVGNGTIDPFKFGRIMLLIMCWILSTKHCLIDSPLLTLNTLENYWEKYSSVYLNREDI